ncbi:hypothetical protein OOU_Y34scaffold00312g2 [Pyricularia oryzae Y34]|uniref:Uncharacterized protein n=1 Tax=Pyricularia oryzae (strain Y34) TaxID=1143189 RepID=A0AA97P2W8_PYRO3|nr:hypothetical protein OOU_Y34scaffold00312g2 [Pyricularia oryzae Y34]
MLFMRVGRENATRPIGFLGRHREPEGRAQRTAWVRVAVAAGLDSQD